MFMAVNFFTAKNMKLRSTLTAGKNTKFAVNIKKVKASHTRYRALGPELIPVYRQSAHR